MTDLKQRILPTVQKPARYTGGEWGEIKKTFIDVPSLACLIAVTAFMLIFGTVKGVLFGALCSFICSFLPSAQHFAEE